MKIYLNGNEYVLSAGTGVQRSPLIEWPDNTRLDGDQRRKDRRYMSSWSIDSWDNGLGIQEIKVGSTANLRRIWDVENVDTRHPSQIILSPKFVTCTVNPSRADLDFHIHYTDQLYFVESAHWATGGATDWIIPARAYKFTAPDIIGSYKNLAQARVGGASAGRIGSVVAVKDFGGQIDFVARARDYYLEAAHTWRLYYAPTLGGSYLHENIAYGGYLGTSGDFSRHGHMAELGGTLHIILYEGDTSRTYFYVAPQTSATLVTSVASISSVIGTNLAPLVGDGVTMYAQLPDGVYDFDLTPAKVVDTDRARDKNCMQTIFNKKLHFKNKKSLIEYTSDGTDSVGYDLNDGLPSDKLGEITAMCSSWKYLFAAVKGASYSHILAMDEDNHWQYYARIPTMGVAVREMFLSDAPDAIDRLWCLFASYGYPGYFLNPMVNPLQAATYSYVPTGYFTKPIFGGDLPEEKGTFFDWVVTGDEIGGGNKIICQYGINGVNPVTTLGVISSTNQQLIFGSPYGLEGNRIQPKFILCGSATGTTPVFRQSVIHYLKKPEQRQMFQFEIDLGQTATERANPVEAVIGSLNYERESKTLMPFWYGQMGTKQVMVIDEPSSENVEHQDILEGERSGKVRLVVAEIL